MGFMLKVESGSLIPGSCIYTVNIDSKDWIYALQVDSILNLNSANMLRASDVP